MESNEVEGRDQGVDIVVFVLLGAVFVTGFLRQSGISLDFRGFIFVNKVELGGLGRLLGWGWWEVQVRVFVLFTEFWVFFLQMMQINILGVFAVGDVVIFFLVWRNNRKVNILYWQMVYVQGTVSFTEGWQVGGCFRVLVFFRFIFQLLVLGFGRWVSYLRFCGSLFGQFYLGD